MIAKLWDWWVIGRRPRVIQTTSEIWKHFASTPVIRARAAHQEPEVGGGSHPLAAIDPDLLDEEPLFI